MSAQPSSVRSAESRLHLATVRCPTCDQPVANEKLNEISAKLAARDQQTASVVRGQLEQDYAGRIAKMDADAKAELQRVANDNAATVERLKQQVIERETVVRQEAEAAFKEKLAEAARQRQSAEETTTAIRAQLEAVRAEGQAALVRAKQDAATHELVACAEAARTAEAKLKERIDETDKAKQAAEARAAEIAAGQRALLDEQRAALEKAKDEAVNIEKAKAFDDKLKMETQLQDMARQLQKKTADELGEGAEVKLLEDLQARFGDDKFHHVGRGNAGADIIHEVIHNGKVCGKIVFDSKDRSAWRNDYISKLRKDQVAAEADHAILSSRVMPAGTKHMHIQDGVIVANPARVLVLVELLRNQIINFHKLRLSTESKTEKTAELYGFMTSELCQQLFQQIESRAADMEELDVKEKKAHEGVWKRRGELIRSIQKAQGDLNTKIDLILGSGIDAADSKE